MTNLTLFVVAGLSSGGLYALVAVGFVLVYKSSGVLNLAHGSLIAVGALGIWWVMIRSGWAELLVSNCQ